MPAGGADLVTAHSDPIATDAALTAGALDGVVAAIVGAAIREGPISNRFTKGRSFYGPGIKPETAFISSPEAGATIGGAEDGASIESGASAKKTHDSETWWQG